MKRPLALYKVEFLNYCFLWAKQNYEQFLQLRKFVKKDKSNNTQQQVFPISDNAICFLLVSKMLNIETLQGKFSDLCMHLRLVSLNYRCDPIFWNLEES